MDFRERVRVCLLQEFVLNTMSSLIAAAVSGDSSCIPCQTKRWDVVLSVTKTMGSFTSFKLEECLAASLKTWRKNPTKHFCKHAVAHSWEEGRRYFYFLPSTVPFTNSSVLFIPHGGLLRFTAGLLTLGNSRQTSMATSWCGSRPESPLWLHTFLCCFPKVPNSNKYT